MRELANVLERSAILAEGSRDRAPSDLALLPPEAPVGAAEAGPQPSRSSSASAIERALAATGGNRRHAAARLGIGLRTLYDKLKRYGLG